MKNIDRIASIVMLSTGLLMGVALVGVISHTPQALFAQTSSPTMSNTNAAGITEAFHSPATMLRMNLNILLREHAIVGGQMLIALYGGLDTSTAQQQLTNNQDQLAMIIQNTYGKNARDTFVQLWNQHMQEYQNYTNAKKNNDTAGMDQAKQNLQTIATKMGHLFGNNGTHLSATTVTNLMMEHINDTLAIVDATAEGNAGQVVTLEKTAYDQAGRFADTLALGMMQDNPNNMYR